MSGKNCAKYKLRERTESEPWSELKQNFGLDNRRAQRNALNCFSLKKKKTYNSNKAIKRKVAFNDVRIIL